MNREIKFRVWDKKRKRLYPVANIYGFTADNLFCDAQKFDIIEQKHFISKIQPNECAIEQFTGRIDKNRKDICEGDYLATPERDVIFEVCYGDCENMASGFYYKTKIGKKYIMDASCSKMEIIGNIHENPELIQS